MFQENIKMVQEEFKICQEEIKIVSRKYNDDEIQTQEELISDKDTNYDLILNDIFSIGIIIIKSIKKCN